MKKIVLLVVLLSLLYPSTAQAEWIEHPSPTVGYWWCDYYGSEYWCQDEWGNWFRAVPGWQYLNSLSG